MKRPTAWRLMLAALAVWAGNFFAGYAIALALPGTSWVRLGVAVLGLASIPVLVALARTGQSRDPPNLVRAAVSVAAIGIAFNALVAIS